MSVKTRTALAVTFTLLAAPLAHAHPLGVHHAAWQAFVHPFLGIDHLLAMLVIGVWAGLAAPARRLLPPLGFVIGLMAGAVLGAHGIHLPAAESAIAISVLLLGPLAARDARMPAVACLMICALAGLFHGDAHGLELAGQGLAGAGFVLGSVLLHAFGFVAARRALDGDKGPALRAALGASGVLGLGLLWMA